jgi:hypothetical protein
MSEQPADDETGSYARPDAPMVLPDLAEAEQVVRRAIDERRPDLVDVVGSGEFSLALRWPVDHGHVVLKRVPPFRDSTEAATYAAVTAAYIEAIEESGVACVRTEVAQLERPDGTVVVYHCQPLLQPASLVSNVLRRDDPDPHHPVVVALVRAITDIVRPPVALDAQASNWVWHDDRVWYLDFSTPLLLDDRDRVQFSSYGFDLEYPRFVRGVFARESQKWLPHFTDPDFVLHDMVGLLHREGLERWCEAVAIAVQREAGITISLDRALANFKSDTRWFPVAHALRRLQRTWLQRTGRRYESLLTPRSSYGPDRRT